MQINRIDNQSSFKSKGSIKRMLKLPSTSKAARDMNNASSRLVDWVYKNTSKINPLEYTIKNRTSLEKAKLSLGERLNIDSLVEAGAKDETFKIPTSDIIKFFNVLSTNMKKPISGLVPKIDKVPSLKNCLDNIKMLQICTTSVSEEIFEIMGGKAKKKAVLIPMRKAIENTSDTLESAVKPGKKKFAESLKEISKDKSYSILKTELKDFVKKLKKIKKPEDMVKIVEQMQKIAKMIGLGE